ncbi:unnamed protein product [Rotaria sp. Silwood2]|nr:unnamed protein product [Rotaria sp. Silwood2]CAF2613280.1 unnamed protein product [Rotaria sp. Silwood2]CAF2874758.1 unnamed protein product [Rotaria sp. Silwood2]CAF3940386.1 unnamed protein product [Rotaria sp. Silwood2]CAF4261720.1 unnamed protein product [Rotaria sp. Silwood2]
MEQPESNPTFCTNNCGFYGSSQFEGMCSKCYRENVNRSYNAGRTNSFNSYYSSSNTLVTSQNLLQDQVIEDNANSSTENDNSDDQLKQETVASPLHHAASTPIMSIETDAITKNDSKTEETKSLSFDCRCGGQFCSLHRYANEHNCTFDYREHGQNEIRKNMPVVQAERVQRI